VQGTDTIPLVARRRPPTLELDDDWSVHDDDLETIDLATGAGITGSATGTAMGRSYRPVRRRAWTAALAISALCLAGVYALLSHRAAATITAAWTQAVADADALSEVMEGLRTGAMLSDVSGEPKESFADARQASVASMRARLDEHRDAISSSVPADPRLIVLRSRALAHLDTWAGEMDAFLVRKGLWLRTPDFAELDEPMDKAAQRWRVDRPRPEPVSIAGAIFLDRLAKPTDAPLPLVVTALTSSGHRLDIDLDRQTVTRTQLDANHVALGAVAYAMRVEGGAIVVSTPGRVTGRLPLEPSAIVEVVEGPPIEGIGGEVADRNGLTAADPVTGVIASAERDGGPVPTYRIVALDPGQTVPRHLTSVEGDLVALSAANGWAVLGRRGDVRVSLQAVNLRTGRVVTIRLRDPYVTAFVAHRANP
jgi:hypothetical protein